MSTTLGIDLATQRRNRAVCELTWHDEERYATVRFIDEESNDLGTLIRHITRDDVTRVGIDVPFGWPVPFIDHLAAHKSSRWLSETAVGEHRRRLCLRVTDLVSRAVVGAEGREAVGVLSVSTDRLGATAMVMADLEDRLRRQGTVAINRAGDGPEPMIEVYPAAALSLWQLPSRGYKDGAADRAARARRRNIVTELARKFDFLRWDQQQDDCIDSDHRLDALLCALMARMRDQRSTRLPQDVEREGKAVTLGRDTITLPGRAECVERARIEGWIHLPRDTGRQGFFPRSDADS